jgi:hypothetical protein
MSKIIVRSRVSAVLALAPIITGDRTSLTGD